MNYILAPSLLAADFQCLAEQMKQTEENGAKYLHFDVMDGMFVPSISFGVPVLKSIKGATNQVMDVHLMVQEPIRYVKDFAQAGADIITVHLEACSDVGNTLREIKAFHLSSDGGGGAPAIYGSDRYDSCHVRPAGIWRAEVYCGVPGKDSESTGHDREERTDHRSGSGRGHLSGERRGSPESRGKCNRGRFRCIWGKSGREHKGYDGEIKTI